MMRSPGERRIEMAAAWAAFLEVPWEESTNLESVSIKPEADAWGRHYICRAYTSISSVMITVDLWK